MTTTSRVSTGILSDAQAAKREEILELLRRAYWMEMETVMSYLANAENLDGVRAEEIAEALSDDVEEELGHARRFAGRIKELYGTPRVGRVHARSALPPATGRRDRRRHRDRGRHPRRVGAIEHYLRIIEACDGVDWATQDMVIEILRDEEGHLRRFERFLREYR